MNLNNYAKLCGMLQYQIGSVNTWVWPLQDTQTFGIILQDWVNGIRPFLLETQQNKKGTVIQAGGNCGLYPLLYTEFFENVYTFEPDPLSFFCLCNNCQQPNIYKFNCAVGQYPECVVMDEVQSNNRGMNKTQPTAELGIPVVTIDSFDFPEVKLIQLDLEGYESYALLGSIQTIKKHKPTLILECIDNFNQVKDNITNILKPIGYKPTKQLSRLDMMFTWSE